MDSASASIFQSQAAQNWLCSGIADLLLVTLVHSQIKVVVCRGLDTEDVVELVAACLASRVVTRLFRT